MVGDEPPPPQLFSLPSTSTSSLLSPLLPMQNSASHQLGPEPDWAGLFSGCMDQKRVQILCETNNNGNKNKGKRKKFAARVAFHTRSSEDILDDGYKWRKYGQKSVKNTAYPRSYYRCTHHTCNVKKQIQRLSKDTSIVVTTYEGIHNHPSDKFMQTLTPLIKRLQFFINF